MASAQSAADPEPATGFTLETHPPERGGRRANTELLCCGCCCCCCCLHSIGGLIGAATTSAGSYDSYTGNRFPSAGPLYWMLFVATVSAVLLLALGSTSGTGDAGVAVILLALGLPGLQLVVSVLAAVVVIALPGFTDKPGYLWSIGRITLGTFIGAAIGFAIMLLPTLPGLLGKF